MLAAVPVGNCQKITSFPGTEKNLLKGLQITATSAILYTRVENERSST